MSEDVTFDNLIQQVKNVHEVTTALARGAINQLLTARNWAIGCYIVEYEQNGKERAQYGAQLLHELAQKLAIKGLDRSMLNLCRIFYLKYPQICDSVNHRLHKLSAQDNAIPVKSTVSLCPSSDSAQICDSVSHKFVTDPELQLSRLSFTHLRAIMSLDDPLD